MDSLSLTVNRNSAPNKQKKTKSSLGTRIGFLKPRTIESSGSRDKGSDYEVRECHEAWVIRSLRLTSSKSNQKLLLPKLIYPFMNVKST